MAAQNGSVHGHFHQPQIVPSEGHRALQKTSAWHQARLQAEWSSAQRLIRHRIRLKVKVGLHSYQPKKGDYQGPVTHAPQETIEIGDGKGHYDTEFRDMYTEKDINLDALQEGVNNKCSNAENKEMQVNLGEDPDAYITVYQDEYRRDQQHKSKLFHHRDFKAALWSA